MSVAACQITEDAVFVGADSALIYGECTRLAVPDQKLFVENGFIVAFSGNIEHANILRFFLRNVELKYTGNKSDVNTEFAAAIYGGFYEYCDSINIHLRTDNNDVLDEFILAFEGKAFLVHGFLTREIVEFEAIGCGEEIARGARYNGASLPRALDTAIAFNRHCSYPIQIYRMDKNTGDIRLTEFPNGDILPT